MKEQAHGTSVVGVADHGAWAVLVTITREGDVLDRRRVELVDAGLSTHPHHHEGQWAVGRYLSTPGARPIPLAEAVALVQLVRTSAARRARESLAAVAAAVPAPIAAISIRACPTIPETIEERIADARAQTVADSVMYRGVLAEAARARGWAVHWYDRERVLRGHEAFLREIGRSLGPPWRADHKLAAASALDAARRAVR